MHERPAPAPPGGGAQGGLDCGALPVPVILQENLKLSLGNYYWPRLRQTATMAMLYPLPQMSNVSPLIT